MCRGAAAAPASLPLQFRQRLRHRRDGLFCGGFFLICGNSRDSRSFASSSSKALIAASRCCSRSSMRACLRFSIRSWGFEMVEGPFPRFAEV
jgi:hypothetical protein